MMTTRYYRDASGVYDHMIFSDSNSFPDGGEWTELAPVLEPGKWPRWDGEGWVPEEDHRGESGYVDGQFFQVTALGPLPENFVTYPPPPPPPPPDPLAELEIQRAGWLVELKEIDVKSVRAVRALALDPDSRDDRDRLAELEARASELRALRGGQA
jgi:hypothetical protein